MIGENVSVRLESTEWAAGYTLFVFVDLDGESIGEALQSVSHDLILAKTIQRRRLSLSVLDVKKAAKVMKRMSDPTIKQMAKLMGNAYTNFHKRS